MELFGFGPHLMIDGYHASTDALRDETLIRTVLSELSAQLGLGQLSEPVVQQHEGSGPEDSGVSGVVVIAGSHISLHTFPEHAFLRVDVFSGKEFDVQKALNYLIEHFEVGRYTTHFINRGKEFPRDAAALQRMLSGEREYVGARIA
ncbi:adenosylmethionine decarboxylase [Deinococcus peraridilitoris]|uniref:S-adenosylmethionine decarboxylase proenzyme n=1 Tax=Deinococcus peraridilitoris (strain DSM 19664 / LMG 22246 / CIP 109416 / KR-200) TaxID=937777 RepID=L0A5L7_DEIPD|nr:adenosylmethionine decarboxylase [Deinococcus peraridilitoris]AFZ68315.1 S-adenosylmethionine decarboxylase proenzyme [Deinococcus peraridilitoris DSM 19664]